MRTPFPPRWFARGCPLGTALKEAALNLLVLWYAMLSSGPINDMSLACQLQGPAWRLLAPLSSAVLAGAMASRLIRRVWIGPVVAATAWIVLSAAWLTMQSQAVERRDVVDMAWALAALIAWSGIAIAVALLLRRWVAPPLRSRPGMQTAVAGVASVVTGVIVLLHPNTLGPLLGAFNAAWPRDSAVPYDVLLTAYYVLGGLASGFTLRLLWPGDMPLSKAPAFMLIGLWCALATRTLLDSEESVLWVSDATASTAPVAVLLALIAVAMPVGLWLARWPARWSEHA